jgi:hypothetical protein
MPSATVAGWPWIARRLLDVVIQEPARAENAGPLGFDNPVAIDRQVDVVAHAPAERASGVLDDLQLVRW